MEHGGVSMSQRHKVTVKPIIIKLLSNLYPEAFILAPKMSIAAAVTQTCGDDLLLMRSVFEWTQYLRFTFTFVININICNVDSFYAD